MNRRPSFIAHTQSSELVQPRDSTLNNPSPLPKIAAMLSEAPANLMINASIFQHLSMCITVISAIGLHTFRFAQWSTTFAINRRDTVKERH